MGDGETVVSEASGAVDYTSASYGLPDGTYNGDDSRGHEQIASVPTGGIGENMDPSKFKNNDSAANGTVEESIDLMQFENGNVTDNAAGSGPAPEHDDGSASALSAEEERLWSIVRANSLDFNAWTALIEETEKVAEAYISKIRKVYDAFLAEFPLCYGYWKKYADHESRVGAMDKVVEVYERAVQGVTYSVDIWLHYCTFAINTYGDPDTIRRLFERGLAYVGTDYLSFPLWDKYIEYEYMQQDWRQIAMIYTRILEHPIQNFDRYFISFKELAETRPLSELRSVEETATAAAAAAAPSSANAAALSTADAAAPSTADAAAQSSVDAAAPSTADAAAPSTADATESVASEFEVKADAGEVQSDVYAGQSAKPDGTGIADGEEVKKYIAVREEMYKKAKEFESKIIGFETAIRRPYFHVRPLNVAELENWHNYLDFIEKEGDLNKVVKLFERCVIACANYSEYWVRYILCMETHGSMDLAENVLARATQVFVKRQPEIHLFAARFKEQIGDISGAQAAYQIVHSEISPGLLEATIKHANMERRLGNLETAFSLYEQAISIEKGKEHSATLPMLYVQYSRFLYLVSGNATKAREILVEALQLVQPSKPLLEALIHFETIQLSSRQIDYLEPLVEKFITPNSDTQNIASAAEREELSCIYFEFLGLFGDAQSIKKAEDRHAKHFLPHKSLSESRKRNADDFLSSDKAKMARSHGGAPPVQPLTGAYPNVQNQWGAGYAQPQAWPPVQTPAQPQPWNPGYGQQAAYGTYGAYPAAYPSPQVPAPVPQTAAYPTYPSTYPAQAYPPQSYAQPPPAAAATTLTPAQQSAPVPQAYYGAYY